MTPVDTGLSSGKDGRKDDARSALQRRSLQSSILLKAAAMQIAWQLSGCQRTPAFLKGKWGFHSKNRRNAEN